MPTPTYVPLAASTLAATAAEVVFAVPSGYKDLILVIDGQSSAGANIYIQANGDTGSNYSYVWMVGTGSSYLSQANTREAATVGSMFASKGNAVIQIFDYSATDRHKNFLARSGNATNEVWVGVSRWANTNAINSLRIYLASGATWGAGTSFSLFGIAG